MYQVFKQKNPNAAKPPEQSKGLGENIACKGKNSASFIKHFWLPLQPPRGHRGTPPGRQISRTGAVSRMPASRLPGRPVRQDTFRARHSQETNKMIVQFVKKKTRKK